MNDLLLLRPNVRPPVAAWGEYIKTREQRLALHDLQDRIWREFLTRLRNPVSVVYSEEQRIIEVLGCVRYCVSCKDGRIHSELRYRPGKHGSAFRDPDVPFLIDLPLLLNAFIVGAFLSEWKEEITREARTASPSPNSPDAEEAVYFPWTHKLVYQAFEQSFLRAIRQSVFWKRLRYQVRDAVALDSGILKICRLIRPDRKSNNLSQHLYHSVLEDESRYRQLYREAPHLVWLFGCARSEAVRVEGETLQSLKFSLCKSMGPRGWRLIARSNHRDFAPIIENTNSRLKALRQYVRLHNALDRNRPIPPKARYLFAEPTWSIESDGRIGYRGIAIHPSLLNSYIDAVAAAQVGDVSLEDDATMVFTWLSEAKPLLDSNQCKLGWPWLARQARHWFEAESLRCESEKLGWETLFAETTLRGYRFVPLSDAWQVRLEAVRHRHCADRFINECRAGVYRLFSVYGSDGAHKATLGMVWVEGRWMVDQIKGFANRPVSDSLKEISESLADGLEIVGEGKSAREAWEAEIYREDSIHEPS